MIKKDITEFVNFGEIDGECLPLTKCICGKEFILWNFVLNIYSNAPAECPGCKRKMIFSNNINVFEIIDD